LITTSGWDVRDLILQKIVQCEGGSQTILNLRKVCSTTKSWIDNLLPAQANLIFSGIPVSIHASRESLKQFTEAPAPPTVTHLKLYNAKFFRDMTVEETQFFNEFVAWWSAKLTILELNAPERIILDAFKAAPLKSLWFNALNTYHHRLSEVQEIKAVTLKLEEEEELKFFQCNGSKWVLKSSFNHGKY